MFRTFRLLSLLGSLLLLTGCLFDNPPSGPSQSIDTWLVGQWETKDKSGHTCRTVVAPASSSHYRISLSGLKGGTQEFDAWIGRVDGFSILILKSLNEGPSVGKYAFFHYELLSPAKPQPGNIGATRIRLSELQLDESCRSLDSYKLRAAIRQGLKEGTLLAPYDVTESKKYELIEQQIISIESSINTDLSLIHI